MATFTVSTKTLTSVLALVNPAPDDVGPWGPDGPVIRDWDWAALNPQPLPPRYRLRDGRGPSPDPWRWGPQPDPYRFGITVRAGIGRILDAFEQAGIIVIGGAGNPIEGAQQQLSLLVDELCGTPPGRKPFPGPWGPRLDADELDPRVLMVAAAQFATAATGLADDHPLSGPLAEAADRMFETAIARLEG